MEVQSLEELNAEEDAKAKVEQDAETAAREKEIEAEKKVEGKTQQQIEAERPVEEKTTEDVTEEKEEEVSGEEEEKEDNPAWMRGDDDGFKPDSDAAATRRKWKGKYKEEKEKASNLEKEVAELRKAIEQPKPIAKDRPKRDAFEDEEKYEDALLEWNRSQIRAETQSTVAAREIEAQKKLSADKVEKALDAHYIRVAKLADKSGIKPETYKAAETSVRAAVDSVFQDGGDTITDELISRLGEGSEKVIYHLGVNGTKRQHLVDLLNQDKSGINAAMWLGQLNATLSAPAKRESQAGKPMPKIQGDKKGGQPHAGAKREYDKAVERGDTQEAFNIRRNAKLAGANTSQWDR